MFIPVSLGTELPSLGAATSAPMDFPPTTASLLLRKVAVSGHSFVAKNTNSSKSSKTKLLSSMSENSTSALS